ncbi:family 78 glycoside hydrolase catalytic domain [Bariatricus sp. SGI.154]|uniref:family 78 glycoside hydrolase catalytic domain n=1 Tax=Bariatricus sp. SGI.154 TaxID=3420549 RepID=UPI003D024B5A
MNTTLGSWITNRTAVPFYARRKFCIEKKVRRAEARVCGLGQFIFYVNGKKVDDHELDPGWTNYRKIIQYVTFDVTEYLQMGDNVLGAEVGNGWFIKMDEHYTFSFPEFMPPNPNPYKPFGKYLVLALELAITYEDGTMETIQADDAFEVKQHPVVMSNVYGSETIDGRLIQEGWNTADYDASDWEKAVILEEREIPKGKLMEQFQPAVKVIRTYDGRDLGGIPKYEKSTDAQRRRKEESCGITRREIFDLGQNMSGILEFEVRGKTGDMIKLYPAEKLGPDGDVDQMAKGWVNLDSCITYIIGKDDVWETCRMKFTYFAGRYVAVEKVYAGNSDGKEYKADDNEDQKDSLGSHIAARIEFRRLRAHAISSAWKTDGSFSCDDKRYEQIYDMIEKTVEANMLSIHTDCPTIERFAWQEPNHLMAPSIFYMKDGRKLWEKFLLDMRVDQHTAGDYFFDFAGNKVYPGDGLMPSQCPCYIPNVLPVPGMGSFYDIIPWGSTCILGTWWHYWFYGDVQIIKDNYEAGMRYLKHLKTKVNEEGFINHGLGDWGNPRNELARENIETAFLYADAITLAKFAKILGRVHEQEELEIYAESVKKNYNEKLFVWNADQGFWCYRAWDHADETFMTQACEALPLYWGMVPEEKYESVANAFAYTLEREGAFISGEVGLPYIIQTARKNGMNDVIARFILRKEHPSYYSFILDGETTLGEYWETNPRSHCHDMMGHIIEWYYNGIAGIVPEEAGFEKVVICPYLPEGMREFTCSYRSVKGEIRVHVKEEDDRIILEVKVPEGVRYRVDVANLGIKGKEVMVI